MNDITTETKTMVKCDECDGRFETDKVGEHHERTGHTHMAAETVVESIEGTVMVNDDE